MTAPDHSAVLAGGPRVAGRGDRTLLALGALGVAVAAADTYVVVLALPDMMAGVGLGLEAFHRATPIISGFLLGYISVLPLVGRLTDLVDRIRVLQWCLAVFVVGSVVTALAVEIDVLVGGRFLQGVGGGGLVPATLALVADRWPPERRGLPLGVVGAVQEVGAVVGPVLGALVLAVWSWRAIFWFGAGVGLALMVAVRLVGGAGGPAERAGAGASARGTVRGRLSAAVAALSAVLVLLALIAPDRLVTDVVWGAPFVPWSGSGRLLTPIGAAGLALAVVAVALGAPRWWPVLRRADPIGAGLLAVALGGLVLTFAVADPEREVVGPSGYVLLPVSLAAFLLAVWRHRHTADPLIPRGVLRGPVLWSVGVSALVGAALVAVVVDIPVLARLTWSSSYPQAALVLVRFLVAVPLGALAGGWLVHRLRAGVVAGLGLGLAAAALAVTSTWGRGSLDQGVWVTLVLSAAGVGLGVAFAPVNAVSLAAVGRSAHGLVSALVVVGRMVGMVVGLATLTAVGLHRYYDTVRALPDQSDVTALVDAGLVQVQTVLAGGALAAAVASVVSVVALRMRHGDPASSGFSIHN
jgi:MFS family permease